MRKKQIEDNPTLIEDNLLDDSGYIAFGSTLLNLALTGYPNKGVAIGRGIRIYGASGAGKSLLAIDLFRSLGDSLPINPRTNMRYKNVKMLYIDIEVGLDMRHAYDLGLPKETIMYPDRKSRGDPNKTTVESVHKYIKDFLNDDSYGKPDETCGLIVIDSLDVLTTQALLKYIDSGKMESGDGMMSDQKAKNLGIMFRDITSLLYSKNVALAMISQVRANLSGYGKATTTSGGHAVQFFTSQIISMGSVRKLISNKTDLPYGWSFSVSVDKNRMGMPGREVTLTAMYGYGIDDVASLLEYVGAHQSRINVEIKFGKGWWRCWFDGDDGKKMHFDDIIDEILKDKSRYNQLVDFAVQIWNSIEKDTTPIRRGRFTPEN